MSLCTGLSVLVVPVLGGGEPWSGCGGVAWLHQCATPMRHTLSGQAAKQAEQAFCSVLQQACHVRPRAGLRIPPLLLRKSAGVVVIAGRWDGVCSGNLITPDRTRDELDRL